MPRSRTRRKADRRKLARRQMVEGMRKRAKVMAPDPRVEKLVREASRTIYEDEEMRKSIEEPGRPREKPLTQWHWRITGTVNPDQRRY